MGVTGGDDTHSSRRHPPKQVTRSARVGPTPIHRQRQTIQRTEPEAYVSGQHHHRLAEETYRRHLPGLRGWAGWFVLIRGDRLGGVFPTYADAATAWLAMYGPVPALIRRIDAAEVGVGHASDDPAARLRLPSGRRGPRPSSPDGPGLASAGRLRPRTPPDAVLTPAARRRPPVGPRWPTRGRSARREPTPGFRQPPQRPARPRPGRGTRRPGGRRRPGRASRPRATGAKGGRRPPGRVRFDRPPT